MKLLIVTGILFTACFLFAYNLRNTKDDFVSIPPSKQRSGDAAKGYQYLITGDYLKSGIPYSFFRFAFKNDTNDLQRTGLNKNLSYAYTAVKAKNGEDIVAPNCLQCHSQFFDGKLIIGLGNSFSDFTVNRGSYALAAEKMLQNNENLKAKYEAAKSFIDALKKISPNHITTTKGVNLADHLALLLAAQRDPVSLKWNDSTMLKIPQASVATDVPPWWLLKKKNGMFYNGFGRGDFGRFLMASNLLTVSDTAEASEVDSHFNDVLAYLLTINPPPYPKPVDNKLAEEGKFLFTENCEQCHGSYGEDSMYPNLLIPASTIKTDSLLYSSNYSDAQFVNWFNKSWFTTGNHPAKLVPFEGYIAPPLDGIWITAPYFHNGSVPNLEGVLNSKVRPKYWTRDFDHPVYDYENIGWKYKEEAPAGSSTYNTILPGFGNQGHFFGDNLTEKERKAIIEYLKTL
jgi:mono/diheme cytochrome c family protein